MSVNGGKNKYKPIFLSTFIYWYIPDPIRSEKVYTFGKFSPEKMLISDCFSPEKMLIY